MSNRQTLALNIPAPSSSLRVQYPSPVRLSLHLRTSSPIPAVGTKRRLSRRSRSCSCGPTARCPGGRFASDILRENPAANGVKKPLFVSRPAKVGPCTVLPRAQVGNFSSNKHRNPRHQSVEIPGTPCVGSHSQALVSNTGTRRGTPSWRQHRTRRRRQRRRRRRLCCVARWDRGGGTTCIAF